MGQPARILYRSRDAKYELCGCVRCVQKRFPDAPKSTIIHESNSIIQQTQRSTDRDNIDYAVAASSLMSFDVSSSNSCDIGGF